MVGELNMNKSLYGWVIGIIMYLLKFYNHNLFDVIPSSHSIFYFHFWKRYPHSEMLTMYVQYAFMKSSV